MIGTSRVLQLFFRGFVRRARIAAEGSKYPPEVLYAAALDILSAGQVSVDRGSERPLMNPKMVARGGRGKTRWANRLQSYMDEYEGSNVSEARAELDKRVKELKEKAKRKIDEITEKLDEYEGMGGRKDMPDEMRELLEDLTKGYSEDKKELERQIREEDFKGDFEFDRLKPESETAQRAHETARRRVEELQPMAKRDLAKLRGSSRRSEFSKKVKEMAGAEELGMDDARAFIYAPILVHGERNKVPPIATKEEEEQMREMDAERRQKGRQRAQETRLWNRFLDEEIRNPRHGQSGHTKERVKRRTLYDAGGPDRDLVMREWQQFRARQ